MAIPLLVALGRAVGGSIIRSEAGAAVNAALRTIRSEGSKIRPPDVKFNVDLTGFNRAFEEYIQFNRRAMSEIVNTKAYYIARNAVNMTDAVDRGKIESELRAPARDYPRAPLGAILVAKQQNRERYSKKTGKRLKDKRGLVGSNMNTAINKLIRLRQNTTNFLRAGWIPAIRDMERFVTSRTGPSYKKVKTKGQDKGGAKGAPKQGLWKTQASVWNSVVGGDKKPNLETKGSPDKVQRILERGLQKAINKEEASMQAYVEKKLQEGANRFNRR